MRRKGSARWQNVCGRHKNSPEQPDLSLLGVHVQEVPKAEFEASGKTPEQLATLSGALNPPAQFAQVRCKHLISRAPQCFAEASVPSRGWGGLIQSRPAGRKKKHAMESPSGNDGPGLASRLAGDERTPLVVLVPDSGKNAERIREEAKKNLDEVGARPRFYTVSYPKPRYASSGRLPHCPAVTTRRAVVFLCCCLG